MPISNWYINSDLAEEEIKKRVDAAKAWLEGLNLVVKMTKDAEALELLNGVLSNVGVARPHKVKIIEPVQGPEEPTLILVPLFSEDAKLTDTTRLLMVVNDSDLPPTAYFIENKPGRIYFNGTTMLSRLVKGLVALHEAKHSQFYEDYKLHKGKKLDNWREETLAFEFEFRLISKLCGTTYDKFLKLQTKRFIKEYDDHGGEGGMLPGPELLQASTIDYVFGLSKSKREAEIRRSLLWTATIFRMFEQLYPTTADSHKDMFMEEISAQ